MINSTTTTPRELSNVYLEFENSIAQSVFDARLSLEIDQQSDEPNNTMQIDESGLLYFKEPTNTPKYSLEKHIQELDKIFGNTINGIREHLITQIEQYGASKDLKVKAFFLKHKGYFKKYLPEGRKPAIYKQFVVYCYFPDATPKDFSLTDNEKELSKLVYEKYCHNYNLLNEVIEELKQEFSTGEPIKIPKLKDNSELKTKAEDILKVLAGRWLNGEKIMTDDQYIEIIEGVFCLIETGEVLQIEKPIIQKATMQFIRRLFRKLNSDLYGKRINDNLIKFLHTYFECFNGSEETTTKNHLNEYKDGIFEKHYNQVLQSIVK